MRRGDTNPGRLNADRGSHRSLSARAAGDFELEFGVSGANDQPFVVGQDHSVCESPDFNVGEFPLFFQEQEDLLEEVLHLGFVLEFHVTVSLV